MIWVDYTKDQFVQMSHTSSSNLVLCMWGGGAVCLFFTSSPSELDLTSTIDVDSSVISSLPAPDRLDTWSICSAAGLQIKSCCETPKTLLQIDIKHISVTPDVTKRHWRVKKKKKDLWVFWELNFKNMIWTSAAGWMSSDRDIQQNFRGSHYHCNRTGLTRRASLEEV